MSLREYPTTLVPAPSNAAGSAPHDGDAPTRHRRWGRVLVPVALLLVLATGLSFVVLSSLGRGGDAWALAFVEGDVSRYRIVISVDATMSTPALVKKVPIRGTMRQTIAVRVVSVDASGTATLEVTIEKASFTDQNGRSFAGPAGGTSRITMAKDGTYVSVSKVGMVSVESTGVTLPGMDRFAPFLPDRPVEPGDSWANDVKVPVPFGTGSLDFRSESEFVREETLDGRRTAVISGNLTVGMDWTVHLIEMAKTLGEQLPDLPRGVDPTMRLSGEMRGTEVSWYDTAANEALKSTTRATVEMTMMVDGLPKGSAPLERSLTISGSFDGLTEKVS
jgi:hypothetical protein